MIRVDVTKAIPAAAYNYLAAFVPGLFFEVSISFAEPGLVRHLAEQLQLAFAPGYYTQILIALVVGFLIGNAAVLFVVLFQRFLTYVYRLKALLWSEFNGRFVFPIIGKLLARPRGGRSRWLQRLSDYAKGQDPRSSPQLLDVERCLNLVAGELLKSVYGIGMDRPQELDRRIWYAAIRRHTAEDARGSIFVVASHAAGWCGLAATHFAPSLWNTWYLGFVSVLILFGVLHDWGVVRRKCDPLLSGMVAIRSALSELREIKSANRRAPSGALDE